VLTSAPYSVYLLTDPQHVQSLPTIQDRLLLKYNPVPLRSWSLDHRLLRSTPASLSDKTVPRYQHLLRLSHRPNNAFIAVSPPTEAKAGTRDTVVTLRNEQYESFFTLLKDRFGALWIPRTYQVINGTAYTAGEFTIRLGELRQSGSAQVRGVVCCIEASSSINDISSLDTQEETEKAKEIIRNDMATLWEQIGYSGPNLKELSTQAPANNTSEESFDEVRMWCSLLRPGT
jgi:hypothetical protein